MFTIYNNTFSHKFNQSLIEKVKMIDMEDSTLAPLKSGDFKGFIKIGAQYSDAVISGEDESNKALGNLLSEIDASYVEGDEKGVDTYYNLYNELASS